MLLSNGGSRLLGGGRAAWETGGGTIPPANVVYAKRLPAQGEQVTAGLPLTGAWTVAFRTALTSLPAGEQWAFCGNIEVVIFFRESPLRNGVYTFVASELSIGLFATGDHTYILASNGATIQAYRDATPVSTSFAATDNIVAPCRWRSNNVNNAFRWAAAMPAAALCNIALDATQRAGLHASMMTLPAAL